MNALVFNDTSTGLIQDALNALHATCGVDARQVNAGPLPDVGAIIELRVGTKWRRYEVEAKSRIDRFVALSSFKAIAGHRPVLLITQGLSTEMAQRCREMDIQFIDTAGNAYLHGDGMYVFVCGMKRSGMSDIQAAPRGSSSPAALRMIFALLADSTMLNASYRTIADAAGIAIGNIGPVFTDLLARGYIAQLNGAGRLFGRRDLLLDEWVAGYANRLRPKLRARRFHLPEDFALEPSSIAPGDILWGGEMAAAELTQYLKPVSRTLYVRSASMDIIVKRLVQAGRLRADPQGALELVEAFWNMDYLKQELAIVPPPLIYADLLASLDPRNIEVAMMVRQKWGGYA